MPPWTAMKKKYALDVADLPIPHAPNVVVIEGIDTEEGTDQMGQPFTRHTLNLVGWAYGLRLNNAAVDVIAGMYGPNSEDAIGRKIALIATAQSAYGKTEMRIGIHPHAPAHDCKPVGVPAHLWTKSSHRAQIAASCGVTMAPAAFTLPPATRPPATPQPTQTKLGDEAAAELIMLLRERGRTWGWLVKHLETAGHTGLSDLPPCDVDSAVKGPSWAVLKNLPITAAIGDRAAEKAKVIATWKPPAQQHAPAGVDTNTGEVMDDIPLGTDSERWLGSTHSPGRLISPLLGSASRTRCRVSR